MRLTIKRIPRWAADSVFRQDLIVHRHEFGEDKTLLGTMEEVSQAFRDYPLASVAHYGNRYIVEISARLSYHLVPRKGGV